ncbi:hypothetical protein JX266_003651 [Neoarthrinium moseri]|nr:hypothetical protein JX266_003651 [Neoarthrinium moseri]
MGKLSGKTEVTTSGLRERSYRGKFLVAAAVGAILYTSTGLLYRIPQWAPISDLSSSQPGVGDDYIEKSLYGSFPKAGDPFHFIPCTSASLLPSLDDADPEGSWAKLFDPDPSHWSWGKPKSAETSYHEDPYSGRGIYLCGYIETPLDYTNLSDKRIVRLAVTKYQVSGLAHIGVPDSNSDAGKKSERTIVLEPGGPGGSGTSYLWRTAEDQTERFSGGTYDVLAWDPRGVNASLPAVSCFPYDADRDHWSLRTWQYREVSPSPKAQLEFADAMLESTLNACWQLHGDIGRFVSTAFVARDLEEIRKAIGEEELTGYLVSYGTGIGQTYANMFPESVGRMILDGTEYVRDHRLLAGFGWTALDNGTNAWDDGFLGECINAGPKYCALAKPKHGKPVTLPELKQRMQALLNATIERPIPGYSKTKGPSLVTYSRLVESLYGAMYNARSWPALAQMLFELEAGNSSLAVSFIDDWQYDPTLPCPLNPTKPTSDELSILVICADAYDAPQPEGLGWWLDLWSNMTEKSWIAGNSRFTSGFPCRHFSDFWPKPAEVYRGDLNNTLKNPVLLIAETYDPATPLRNGKRLLEEMGKNARLIVHHGYGHGSRDASACTDSIARAFILNGTLPEEHEIACYANEKPYLYGIKDTEVQMHGESWDPVIAWREHKKEIEIHGL